ncbi:MAG: KilA-N domain-containing protein, partial [Candidatus Nanopelagicaceae bacterium]
MSEIIKSFKGRAIRIRETDRYVCLTDMASANGKQYHDWARLKGTVVYLEIFSESMGIPV